MYEGMECLVKVLLSLLSQVKATPQHLMMIVVGTTLINNFTPYRLEGMQGIVGAVNEGVILSKRISPSFNPHMSTYVGLIGMNQAKDLAKCCYQSHGLGTLAVLCMSLICQ